VRTGVVLVAIAASAGPVYAQSSTQSDAAPGASALKRARAAWDDADFDVAPRLFQDAIKAGGLDRDDVLDAYVRMGSAFAVSGKKTLAYGAFRHAALLDPGFRVPPEAGKKAIAVASQARRAQARVGSLTIDAQAPDEVDAGAAFGVEVALAPARAPLVDSVTFEARDDRAGRAFEQASPPGSHLHFDVPSRMSVSGARLTIRIEARDAHDNQLAIAEKQVRVATRPVAVAAPPAPAKAPPLSPLQPVPALHSDQAVGRASSGGFWSTAWPYVIGGAALAAGGAAVWFATRPTEDVNVLAARIEVH
jgi:hypothetical protein